MMAGDIPPLLVEVQLQLDEFKAQMSTLQKDMNKIGNAAEAQKAKVSGLGGSFKELALGVGKLFAVAEAINFMKEAGKVAVEDAQSQRLLNLALENTTNASKAQEEAVDKQVAKLSDMSGVLESKIRPSLGILVRATGDSTKALKLQQLALDVSAGTGKNLTTVTMAMSRALSGSKGALNRLVPGAAQSGDAIGFLEKKFKGAAKTVADHNPYMRFQQVMEKIKISLGQAVVPIMTLFVKVLNALMPAIKLVAKFVTDLVNAFMPFVAVIMKALIPILKPLLDLLMIIVKLALKPLLFALKLVTPMITIWGKELVIVVGVLDKLFQFIDKVQGMIERGFAPAIKLLSDKFAWLGGIINPILDTIGKLLGVDTSIKLDVSADTSGLADLSGITTGDFQMPGAGGNGKGSAKENPIVTFAKETQKGLLAAQKDYQTAVKKANEAYQTQIQNETQSFRDAFANATKVDVGEIFNQGYQTAGLLIANLKNKLAETKNFATDIAALGGQNFSESFIQQIENMGAFSGDQLAKLLLSSTPEVQQQIQDLYSQAQTASNTGVDAISTSLTDKFTTATKTLADAMTNAAAQLQTTLNSLATALATKVKTATGLSASDKSTVSGVQTDLAKAGAVVNNNVVVNAPHVTDPNALAHLIPTHIKFNQPLVPPTTVDKIIDKALTTGTNYAGEKIPAAVLAHMKAAGKN